MEKLKYIGFIRVDKLPISVSEISDYDLSAPFVSESCEESKIVGEWCDSRNWQIDN